MFDALKIASTGLMAQQLQLSTIANNLANSDTTITPQGIPYREQEVVMQAEGSATQGPDQGVGQGVMVTAIIPNPAPFPEQYDPSAPGANAQGMVQSSNVNVNNQMVDMMRASQAYQADTTAFTDAKTMDQQALNIGA